MERTLAAREHLPGGQALVQVIERIPAFPIPILEERGFAYAIADGPGGYRTTIWHRPSEERYGRELTCTSAPAATYERPQAIQARA